MSWDDPETVFLVVVNHEEQYSIWPEYKAIPEGWRAVGKRGPKAECLTHIEEVWTDMRPLSLRQFHAKQSELDSAQRTLLTRWFESDVEQASTCIVVPAYNEAARLDVAAFDQYLGTSTGVRFLFVDDGSTDQTAQLLRNLGQRWPERVSLLELASNQGKAEAVRAGVWHCTEDSSVSYVGFWDADWATPLEAIDAFTVCLSLHPEIDIVLGARVALLGRKISRKAHRHYLGRIAASFASLVLGIPVYDTQCGAKLIRVSARTRDLFATRFQSGWVFDVELIARYLKTPTTGTGLYELPLDRWTDVGESKVRPIDFLRAFGQMARIYRQYRLPQRYHHLVDLVTAPFSRYLTAGAVGTAAHYLTLAFSVEVLGCRPWIGSALGSTSGALVNYVLNYHFIFASNRPHSQTLIKFLLVAALGIGMNSVVVKVGHDSFGVSYWLAQLVATSLFLVCGFVINKLWTFKSDDAG